MIPTFRQVRLALDVEARAAFDPAPANRSEAGVKAGEMDHHLTWAASLLKDGYLEDAYARYEKAEIAAAGAVMSLTGARLKNEYRGREHHVKKHFLVAALTAAGRPAPALEQAMSISHVRNLLDYNASVGVAQLTPQNLDIARQVTDRVRSSVLGLLAEANITVAPVKGLPLPQR